MWNLFKNSLVSLKDLGDLSYFLGIQIQCDDDTLHLNHHKYVTSLVAKVGIASSKPLPILKSSTTRLSKFDSDLLMIQPFIDNWFMVCNIVS